MQKEQTLRIRYIAGDFLATSLAWLIFNTVRFSYLGFMSDWEDVTLTKYLLSAWVLVGQLVFPVMMLGIYYLSGFYNSVFFKSRIEELINTCGSTLLGCIIIYFVAIVNDPIPDRASNYELIFTLWCMMFGLVWIFRLINTEQTRRSTKRDTWYYPVLIIGAGASAVNLYNRF